METTTTSMQIVTGMNIWMTWEAPYLRISSSLSSTSSDSSLRSPGRLEPFGGKKGWNLKYVKSIVANHTFGNTFSRIVSVCLVEGHDGLVVFHMTVGTIFLLKKNYNGKGPGDTLLTSYHAHHFYFSMKQYFIPIVAQIFLKRLFAFCVDKHNDYGVK